MQKQVLAYIKVVASFILGWNASMLMLKHEFHF